MVLSSSSYPYTTILPKIRHFGVPKLINFGPFFDPFLIIFDKNRSKNDEKWTKTARRVPQSGHFMRDLAKKPGFSRFLINFGSDRSGPEILVKNVIFVFFRGTSDRSSRSQPEYFTDPSKSGSKNRPKSALFDPFLDPFLEVLDFR